MTSKNELLRNNYTFEQAESLQIKYQSLIKQPRQKENAINFESIKVIAGVDISYYSKDKREYGVACALNWDLENESIEEYSFENEIINFPYKPGFLGFRECKLFAKAISKLQKRPELVMCDGHGKIHPKRFGEAVQLGFALNVPTIGVAKNPLIGYSKWKEIERIKGNKTPVWAENPGTGKKTQPNELLGYAVCLKNFTKPVFISEGYNINIDTALKICLATSKDHRQPEPLFLADHLSKEEVKKFI